MFEHPIPAAAEFPLRTRTRDLAQTRALATRLAPLLQGGEVLLLHGPLGAGKTAFVQALCAALDVGEEVTSPTFTLANRYAGRLVVHHLDFYRLDADADLADIGVDAILDEVEDGAAVLVAEWPARLVRLAPRRLELLVLPTAGTPDVRDWHLRGAPGVPLRWEAAFAAAGTDPC